MAMLTTAQIRSLLVPGLQTVFGNFETYKDLYHKVYRTVKSEKAFETDLEMQGLGMAQGKQEAGPVAQGSMQQGYPTTYTPQWYGLSFQITRAAIEDNLYQNQFTQYANHLKTSLRSLRNYKSMAIFNNAFTAQSRVSDGQPMCSTAHPIANGEILSNTFANPVGLTESSIEDALSMIKQWKALSGLKIDIKPKSLYLPTELVFQAARILKSTLRAGTGNNDINALKEGNFLPGGYETNPYLTTPNNWFILTDADNGFKFIHRNTVDVRFQVDNLTDVTTVRANERYAFGTSNWRCVFGSKGTV